MSTRLFEESSGSGVCFIFNMTFKNNLSTDVINQPAHGAMQKKKRAKIRRSPKKAKFRRPPFAENEPLSPADPV